MMKSTPAPAQTKELTPLGRSRQSLKARVVEIIKQRIKTGIYPPGERLPSIRALSGELKITPRIIQLAVEQLESESILETRHGVGITVLQGADCRDTALLFGFVQPYFSPFSMALQAYLEDALDEQHNLCWMKSSRNDARREREEIERLIASGVNGLLIWPVDGDTNGEFLQDIARRLPVVLVDRTVPGATAPAVLHDAEEGARQILRHLYKMGRRRILFLCDPADISGFHLLKQSMREEAKARKKEDSLTFMDYPVISMIENSYKRDYELADACYEQLAPIFQSGEYDAIFCPQCEFFDLVFPDKERAVVLSGIHTVALRVPGGPSQSRHYYELGIEEWKIDTAEVILVALNLLQDMTLKRRTWQRTIRLPITLLSDPNERDDTKNSDL